MIRHTTIAILFAALSAAGCVKIEGGFKYEYDGRVLREDGKTPAKNVAVRLARAEPSGQVNKVDTTDKASKASVKYNDKGMKRKTDSAGHYVGILETSHGWHYEKVMGANVGATHPPAPPLLDEVIVFVDEKGTRKTGYRMKVPAENQLEATSGVRKIHLPDLLLPAPTTKATTRPATQP